MTTDNLVTSITEAAQSTNSSKPHNTYEYSGATISDKTLRNLESEFNATLGKYKIATQLLNEERIKNKTEQSNVAPYYNSAISNEEGEYYYINNYGYYNAFTTGSWENKSTTCPTKTIPVTNDTLSKLKHKKGPDMNPQQACGVAGHIIQRGPHDTYAWVDITGVKHVYSASAWKNRSKPSCHKNPIKLTITEFDNIPTGDAMQEKTECRKTENIKNLLNDVDVLNKKLADLAKQIYERIEILYEKNKQMRSYASYHKKFMDKNNIELQNHRGKIDKIYDYQNTSLGQVETSSLNMTANKYHYNAWILLAIAIIAITIRSVLSGETNIIVNGVVLIFCLLLVYWASVWIYNKIV